MRPVQKGSCVPGTSNSGVQRSSVAWNTGEDREETAHATIFSKTQSGRTRSCARCVPFCWVTSLQYQTASNQSMQRSARTQVSHEIGWLTSRPLISGVRCYSLSVERREK